MFIEHENVTDTNAVIQMNSNFRVEVQGDFLRQTCRNNNLKTCP